MCFFFVKKKKELCYNILNKIYKNLNLFCRNYGSDITPRINKKKYKEFGDLLEV